jgi:hypothetical protein
MIRTLFKMHSGLRVLGALLAPVMVSFYLLGCSERITSAHVETSAHIQVDLHRPSGVMNQAIELAFLLVVSESESGDILATEELVFTAGYVRGTVDSLPSSEPLNFVLNAIEIPGEKVIYSGSALGVILASGQVTEVNISMSPVVPMLKINPRFVSGIDADSFSVDVKAFNIEALYGLSFRLELESPLEYVRMEPSSTLPTEQIIFFSEPYGDSNGVSIWGVAVSQTDNTTPIVDESGNATLATLWLRLIEPPTTDSAYISLYPTDAVCVAPVELSLDTIYTDDCLVEFSPSK